MKNKIVKSKKTAKTPPAPRIVVKAASKKEIVAEEVSTAEKIALFNLRAPKGAFTHKKILGRGPGSGHGKTSTRGSKGQTSRSGRDFYAGFEGGQTPLIRRIPKRGFTSKFKKVYQIINLSDLKKIKEPTITLELLEQKGLIKNKEKLVKVLGEGEIKNPVTVQAHAFSKKASDGIKNAGGKVDIISLPRIR
jgi:large subunit ribosomal protein L15